jgi:hypothetical protein
MKRDRVRIAGFPYLGGVGYAIRLAFDLVFDQLVAGADRAVTRNRGAKRPTTTSNHGRSAGKP